MSNGLTGAYDAVVEIRLASVNRILASIHKKGSGPNVSPKFPHSLTARVGDVPKIPQFELAGTFLQDYFGDDAIDVASVPHNLLATVQENLFDVQRVVSELAKNLGDVQVADRPASIGDSAEIATSWARLFDFRGTAWIQIGTPAITLAHGSTSEVMVKAEIRAHYLPDPGTTALPAPIHGEVRAVLAVRYNAAGKAGKPAVEAEPAEDNSKNTFIPAAGTPAIGAWPKAMQVAQITAQLRRFLRKKFEAMSAELPEGFPFRQFKGLVADGGEAIALPLMLSGQHIPALALNSVNTLFLKPGDHFAVAISPHYIRTALQPALQAIEDFHVGFKIKVAGVTTHHFTAGVSSASVMCETDALLLTVTGGAKLWKLVGSDEQYNFTIKQKFALALDAASQVVSLQPVGDVSISGLPQKWKDKALPKIKDARDDAVAAAQPMIQKELGDRRTKLNDALKRFDAAANAKYTAVEIEPAGVILRGSIALSKPLPAVVDIGTTPSGMALSAFKSWIPGGNIDRFTWSWLRPSGDLSKLLWGGRELHVVTDPHRFTFALGGPGQPQPGERVCLQVEGTQLGSAAEVLGGEICHVDPPWWLGEVTGVHPVLASILIVTVWGPDPGPDGVIDSAIVAHVNVRTDIHLPADAGELGIVHFVDDRAAEPLPLLSEAVLGSRHRDAAIPVIVVLPQGALAQKRSLVERKLGRLAGRLRGPLVITEDYQNGWTQAFDAPKGSATYLLRAGGERVWHSAGPLLAKTLTAGLNEQEIMKFPASRPPSFGLRSGQTAPDALFAHGDDPALPRLRGERLLLIFWKSWSSPCLSELRRLERLHERADAQGITIVAIGDGEDQESVREIARKHRLRFTLVPDPERRIAKAFRVNCWPTTMSIDEHGLIQRVHHGMTLERPAPTPHQ